MQEVKSVSHAEVGGKRILMRVDYNVPLENGKVMDDTRIRATLPTISVLRDRGASKIILLTHVGRPDGKVVEELRTAQVFEHLKTLVSTTNIEMLENLRFDPREEVNDESLAKELAAHGDVYVNEAFSNSHRTHTSMVALPKLLPHYIGLQCEEEFKRLSEALHPPQGSVAIMVVTKTDKMALMQKLSTLYHKVLVGGPVPVDFVPTAPNVMAPTDGIPQREGLFDIGPQTLAAYIDEVSKAPLILWNGPLGWYEKGYKESTDTIAQTIISKNIRAVIGGGDTLNALKNFKFGENVFLSTGGGAMLQFLADGTLPAIDALKQ